LCIDTSFDNSLQDVADVSLHLTPRTLESELRKLQKSVPILVHHLKPPCVDKIHEEIRRLKNPDIEFLEQGREYEF
ncbi:MAG TPA: 3',5'-cyclic-nucleotide phosphodiesterase, partial [Thermoanaerobaculia bacterium]|nr:3',5'-cyclic-nucleotide phosphodiesterase [Thermoanaerobaculia bacterium]